MGFDGLKRLMQGLVGKPAAKAAPLRSVAQGVSPQDSAAWQSTNSTVYESRGDETLDELLALGERYRKDMLVADIARRLEARVGRDIGKLTVEERTVLAVETLNSAVNGDGFIHFFCHHGALALVIVDALGRVGCPHTQAIARDALAALKPHATTSEAIEEAAFAEDSARDEALGACESRFFEYVEPLDERVFAYATAHRERISL